MASAVRSAVWCRGKGARPAAAHRRQSPPCDAGYITVFLVALVTDRAFLLHQPADVHARWEDIYEQKHIAWLAEPHLDYDKEQTRDDFVRLDSWCAFLACSKLMIKFCCLVQAIVDPVAAEPQRP